MRNVDGSTSTIPANTTFEEWKEQYIKDFKELNGLGSYAISEKMQRNASYDEKQLERYKDIFGSKFPQTLDAFQKLKYTETDLWESFKSQARSRNYLQQQLGYVMNGEKLFIPTRTRFERVVTIAGAGADNAIRDIDRLISVYGGTADDWTKRAGKVSSAKYIFDVHWYERDCIQYEVKLKYRMEKKP